MNITICVITNSRMEDYLAATGRQEIANEAKAVQSELLTADEGCQYDQLIEIDLSTLEPHVNGPFTPDLATAIGDLGETAKKNGWPLEVKGKYIRKNISEWSKTNLCQM